MASWTLPADVTGDWIGDGAPTDTAKIQRWIDKAEREIIHQVPDIQGRIAAQAAEVPANTTLLDTAVDVVVAMVTRVFRNPDGVRQVNETTGPFTASKTYGGDVPGELTLTDRELAKLQEAQVSGAFTIDLFPSTSPYAG